MVHVHTMSHFECRIFGQYLAHNLILWTGSLWQPAPCRKFTIINYQKEHWKQTGHGKKEVWHLLLLCVHEKPNWANVKNKENENDNNGVTTSNAECSIKKKGSERYEMRIPKNPPNMGNITLTIIMCTRKMPSQLDAKMIVCSSVHKRATERGKEEERQRKWARNNSSGKRALHLFVGAYNVENILYDKICTSCRWGQTK